MTRIKHILDITNEPWFHERPWLFLGTGPSLDNFNPKEHTDKNIAALYTAADVCDTVDLLYASDQIYYQDYFVKPEDRVIMSPEHNLDNVRYIATRSVNYDGHIAEDKSIFWEYDCDINNYHKGVRLMPEKFLFPCSNTSAMAMMVFGLAGIRRVFTYGIDGGPGLSTKVSEGYKKLNHDAPVDFDLENQGVFGHARTFGIQLIKL